MTMSIDSPLSRFLSRLHERIEPLFQTPFAGRPAPGAAERDGILARVMSPSPLSVFIPERFGGRGQKIHECLATLEACSYHSLPLSLVVGINGGLFLQPVSKYADDKLQSAVFRRFLDEGALGGLMITEPDFGSDALQMRTRFSAEGGGYRLSGTKHWGGLTGRADFWLLTARGQTAGGDLERNISFFVWDRDSGGIEVEEYYASLGLELIPYGRNRIDTFLPADRRLSSKSSGVRMLLDLLHRSRLQFPGMAMGYLTRLLDEGIAHARSRRVGGRPLAQYDQVEDRLSELQGAYTACSAMCAYSSDVARVENDCSTDALPANSIKSVITDIMQAAAQSLLQLVGAKGYRRDHIAGASLVNSRPFQIFEGSNDILYEQISEAVLKTMQRLKETNLYRFAKEFELTKRAADRVRTLLDFSLVAKLSQRKMVDLGRILGRLISMQMVVELGERGFRRDLIDSSLALFTRQIAGLSGTFGDTHATGVAEEYKEGSAWLSFLQVEP